MNLLPTWPNMRVWIREDSYHDEFPVAVYAEDGFIKRRFMSEEDARTWIDTNGFRLQTGYPPGIRFEIIEQDKRAEQIRAAKQACMHNHMVQTDDLKNAWKCVDCGYIYGLDTRPTT